MAQDDKTYGGKCYCGAVTMTMKGEPSASAICHCESCRKWHAAPINAWSIWPSDSVKFAGGKTVISSEHQASERVSCASCGGCVANIKPQIGMTVVYPMTYAGSGPDYVPSAHIYYEERVIDIADGLPKFADMPEHFGGSGRTIDEPIRSGWCG